MDIKNNILYIGRIEEEEEESEESNDKLNDDELSEEEKHDTNSGDEVKLTEDAKGKKSEKVVFIGSMEDNENFEAEPKIENAAVNTLIEASGRHKTNIYEVEEILFCDQCNFKLF